VWFIASTITVTDGEEIPARSALGIHSDGVRQSPADSRAYPDNLAGNSHKHAAASNRCTITNAYRHGHRKRTGHANAVYYTNTRLHGHRNKDPSADADVVIWSARL
jgi:hypothetical protein